MDVSTFSHMVVEAMGVTPTEQQRALIDALSRFCASTDPQPAVFIINGYAGTGKTSVVAALVRALTAVRRPTVLLAPTGRAAKVLSSFAGKRATTIHRRIYRGDPTGASAVAGVAENTMANGVYIVDEASMIGGAGDTTLLEDLLQYVFTGDNSRLILMGDPAQLPPVGCDRSPALEVDVYRALGIKTSRAMLTRTVRQQSESGILYNATALRRAMRLDPIPVPRPAIAQFDDVHAIDGQDLPDDLSAAYSRSGINDTILVTRSNRRAMQYNMAIRADILEKDELLTPGEPIIVAKNNYFWTSRVKGADFLANGDVVIVDRINAIVERSGMRFADVTLSLPDNDELHFDVKIILDSLTSESASLTDEEEARLAQISFGDVDATTLANPVARMKLIHTDPYFNALRVKYAYAVTCHKAQGGQWSNVFVDMAGIPKEALTTLELHRWLYTAITRATRQLYLISPPSED